MRRTWTLLRNERFVSVLIVDRHAVARQGLKALLSQTRSFAVSECATVTEAIESERTRHADVILLGSGDPDEIRGLAVASPASKIVVLGLEEDPLYARRALEAGAAAYLARDKVDSDLPRFLDGQPSG